MIFMSKETNKKTGLTKLEKENLGSVSGGYTIVTYDDGTVEVRGTPRPGARLRRAQNDILPEGVQPRVFRRFNNIGHAVL